MAPVSMNKSMCNESVKLIIPIYHKRLKINFIKEFSVIQCRSAYNSCGNQYYQGNAHALKLKCFHGSFSEISNNIGCNHG